MGTKICEPCNRGRHIRKIFGVGSVVFGLPESFGPVVCLPLECGLEMAREFIPPGFSDDVEYGARVISILSRQAETHDFGLLDDVWVENDPWISFFRIGKVYAVHLIGDPCIV